MSNWLTIAQIAEQTDKVKQRRFFRPFDLARAVALREFLEELEAEHGEDFRIYTVSPKYILPRDKSDEAEPVFTFDLWASFMIGDVKYYVQMNENPFFDSYFSRTWRKAKGETSRVRICEACGSYLGQIAGSNDGVYVSEYPENMNDVFYNNTNWDSTPETIAQLKTNLRAALNHTNSRTPDTYTKDIPAYERKVKQTIYNH